MTAEAWEEVARVEEVPEDGTLRVTFKGEPVCLYNIGGTIYATHDTCSHAEASLADGFIVEQYQIECPLHAGTFDIRTGKAVREPCTVDIKTYRVKAVESAVYLSSQEVE